MGISLTLLSCKNNNPASNEQPKWLTQKIDSLKDEPVQNPPIKILAYDFKGETVYYITAPCCDQYNSLFNKNGELICYPDGGFTGKGDGRCPEFHSEKSNERLIWQDDRQK